MNQRLELLFQDTRVVGVNKPAGLAVQGGSGVEESLEDQLQQLARPGRKIRLVHRLDRDTSGVLIAAKTQPAAAFLSAAFADRAVHKTYLALVCAAGPMPAAGEISAPLVKAPGKIDVMKLAQPGEAGAQEALTRYRLLQAVPGAALLALEPVTGRMHQLRAHLASIGHPIAGDGKYGGLFRLGEVRIGRLMLHAAKLDAPHPEGARLCIEAPMPEEFLRILAALALDAPLIENGVLAR